MTTAPGPSAYTLRCYACSQEYRDDGVRLRCDQRHAPSFLHSIYRERTFTIDTAHAGILRYAAWLPLREQIDDVARTAVFSSDAVRALLHAPNLWIAFNGYWPERDAFHGTATFKDLEAAAVLARFPRDGRVLVAASAGNTAAALARACGRYHVPALIVAPERAMARLRLEEPANPCVRFVAITGESTYDDAIAFAKYVADDEQLMYEGGASNVARRDGIGTTMLATVETMGRLPDYYVQAVGSGAGVIAAHEAAQRVLADGRYGSRTPRLHLVQNAPSAPIYDAWKAGKTDLLIADKEIERIQSRSIAADVLSTRVPPYALAGGLYSILVASAGDVSVVSNDEIIAASRVFEELVGIDIEPAGAAAFAGLQKALAEGSVDPGAGIVLHVTGGGRRQRSIALTHKVEGPIELRRDEILSDEAVSSVRRLFAHASAR